MTAPDTMPRCQAGERCRDYDPSRRVPAELYGDLPMCDACLYVAARAVEDLVRDYSDLEQQLPPSVGQWSDGQPRGSGEAPIPLRTNVEALQRDIWWVLTAWEAVVREVEHLSDEPTRVRAGADVQRAATILAPRVDRLSTITYALMWSYPVCQQHRHDLPSKRRRHPGWHCPDCARGWSEHTGVDALADLTALRGRARITLGLGRPVWSVPGMCVRCRREELRREVRGRDSDTVWCNWCGDRRSYGEYERAAKAILSSHDQRAAAVSR